MHLNHSFGILSLLLQISLVFGAPKPLESYTPVSLKWIPKHATSTAPLVGRGASGSGGPVPTGTGSGLYRPTGTLSYRSPYPTGTGSYNPSGTGSYNPSGTGSYNPSGTGSYNPTGTGLYNPTGTGYSTKSRPYSTGTQPQLQSSPTASSTSPSCPSGTSPAGLPPQSTVYVGFQYALNFDFVSKQTEAQLEIFQFLPPALSYGLSVCPSYVTVQALLALDTTSTLNYITTLAQVQIPTASMGDFVDMICNKNSKVYNNPGTTTSIRNSNELVSYVSQGRVYTEKPDFSKDSGPNGLCGRGTGGKPPPKSTSAPQGTNLNVAG